MMLGSYAQSKESLGRWETVPEHNSFFLLFLARTELCLMGRTNMSGENERGDGSAFFSYHLVYGRFIFDQSQTREKGSLLDEVP